ncbi:hypothetical protein AAVH_33358 [Aphelenchoides avenae]|nr:hypothetical protein AAVH_33358 [Aphelenchus avenae]
MSRLGRLVLFLLTSFAIVDGLRCWKNLPGTQPFMTNCTSTENFCMKAVYGKIIEKSCFGSPNQDFDGVTCSKEGTFDIKEHGATLYCCNKDLCNSALMPLSLNMLMLLTMAFVTLL